MQQPQLFDTPGPKRIVNVASVPKRSPFRYPGGKTWLVPEIREWLLSLPARPKTLVEPFAGGGIVGLTAAFEQMADHVILVELDPDVASVWQTMLSDDGKWLADQIARFNLTWENVELILATPPTTVKERAFKTMLRNRISHGGILAPGSGMLKNGENGRGIASRWYPETLSNRIVDIYHRRDRLSILVEDGIQVIRQHATNSETVFFIDPPYTAAGKRAGRRLYTFFELDHDALFASCQAIQGDFLMTYDNAHEVRLMAESHGFDVEAIPMKNTHHAEMSELLIGRDLTWARSAICATLQT